MGDASPTGDGTGQRRVIAASAGRIDAVLAEACPDLSRSRIQRLIAGGYVLLNGRAARKSSAVAIDDTIDLSQPPSNRDRPAIDLELAVLYEDDAVCAIDKPAGLAVHGAPGDSAPSIARWMLSRLGPAAAAFDVEYPGVVHRLDKDTSGVLLLARTPAAQTALSAAFQARACEKTYLAITDGAPPQERALIEAPIGRHPGDRTRMAVVRHGREARTAYRVLGQARGHALLLLNPETGRTHQIRVHLDAIGCPVAFDRVYGTEGAGRQMLHAWRLRIPHPLGGWLEVTAPLPADFVAFVRSIGLEPVASPYTVLVPPRREGDNG